jgi:hypothetical protein
MVQLGMQERRMGMIAVDPWELQRIADLRLLGLQSPVFFHL